MGKQRPVDKVISPAEIIRALQAGSITTAQAQAIFNGVIPIGDYKGIASILDLDKLVVQPLVVAERLYALDRVDSRDGVNVTVLNLAALATVATGEIVVPAGEIWYLNRLSVVCPAADATGTCSFNILVSSFPKTAVGGDKPYLPANVTAMGATTDIDLPAQGQLGEELRLVGGEKLTLQLVVTVAFTADKVFRLNPWGRQGKLLVA
jgi:hypothetical protein